MIKKCCVTVETTERSTNHLNNKCHVWVWNRTDAAWFIRGPTIYTEYRQQWEKSKWLKNTMSHCPCRPRRGKLSNFPLCQEHVIWAAQNHRGSCARSPSPSRESPRGHPCHSYTDWVKNFQFHSLCSAVSQQLTRFLFCFKTFHLPSTVTPPHTEFNVKVLWVQTEYKSALLSHSHSASQRYVVTVNWRGDVKWFLLSLFSLCYFIKWDNITFQDKKQEIKNMTKKNL